MDSGVTTETVHKWLERAESNKLFSTLKNPTEAHKEILYPKSIRALENSIIACIDLSFGERRPSYRRILVFGADAREMESERYALEQSTLSDGFSAWICPLSEKNLEIIRTLFPETAPSPLPQTGTSFGTGDRLGIATTGHIRAIGAYDAVPVLGQQSVRELNLTGRTYRSMVNDASWAVFQEGYTGPWVADGDHLKTPEWVREALEQGCTMITADLSDYIHSEFQMASEDILKKEYQNQDEGFRRRVEGDYTKLTTELDTGETVRFDEYEIIRCVLIYSDAVQYAKSLFQSASATGKTFSFELSIDETGTPTSPQAHIFFARECRRIGVDFVSLAPRFIGEFQKGIDYIGDINEYERDIRVHAAIARKLGHKLSIHSGSDKFSVFPCIGRYTEGDFHIKTSGTSWLEALRVVARKDSLLFREIHDHAFSVFPDARTYYHVTTDLTSALSIEELHDDELEETLRNPANRQVLHISYGEIFKNGSLKQRFFGCLEQNITDYWDSLKNHMGKHLETLECKKRGIK